jgi:hypothetical protein
MFFDFNLHFIRLRRKIINLLVALDLCSSDEVLGYRSTGR